MPHRNLAVAFASFVLATGLCITSPVSAREATRTVRHADLDLSRPSDRAVFERRVSLAIEAVCGSYATVETWQVREIDRCRAEGRARTAEQLARVNREAPAKVAER